MHNRDKTHCPHGHPYDETNTIWGVKKPEGYRTRKCAECMRRNRRRRAAFYDRLEKQDPNRLRRHSDAKEAWHRRNPEKKRAHTKVFTELRAGRLTRPDRCSACGTECKPQAHHEDYSKPLEIIWLCAPCHRAVDRKYAPAKVPVTGGESS